MSIGYACLSVGVPGTALRTCTKKYATEDTLQSIIAHNLAALDQMLAYNRKNGIRLFRISSDIIPFGSSPVNTLDWTGLFAQELAALGEKARRYGMRLSMHPGQYTVINSPNTDVVARAVEDLAYHCRFLDALGLDRQHKMILHIGGVYGDKAAATERFVCAYHKLSDPVKARLVIENDDRQYTVEEVLEISGKTGAPVVFDNLHHQINPAASMRTQAQWCRLCAATWRDGDGRQKVHYAQQAQGRRPGAHAETITLEPFLEYYHAVRGRELDIMLEVKDKNRSAVKCINATRETPHIKYLEAEWARYKYAVLEHDPNAYLALRTLLKDKQAYPWREFYATIEQALRSEADPGNARNAAQHVWGYFKDIADEREKRQMLALLDAAAQGEGSFRTVKRKLYRLAEKYRQEFLLRSYYFMDSV